MHLRLGNRSLDLYHRALVMGVLNTTPDSAHGPSRVAGVDHALRRVEQMVAEGADIVDVGGVAGGGRPVGEAEEADRVVPVVEAVCGRIEVAVSVDTSRASVAAAAFAAGAVLGNDITGFSDPGYLPSAAAAGASVVATHGAGAGGAGVDSVIAYLSGLEAEAAACGLGADRIVLDAGLGLGKTDIESLTLLRATDRLALLGPPVLVAASRKDFLAVAGATAGETPDLERSVAAAAVAVALGSRIIRAHDVAATRRVCDTLAAIVSAA